MAQEEKELIVMSQKKSARHDIIKKPIDQKINGTEDSVQINLSVQTKRLTCLLFLRSL